MASKQGKTGNLGMVAFIAVILVAIAFILIGLQAAANEWNWDWFKVGKAANILRWVAEILMTAIIVYCSYDFAMKQSKVWRIIWWILAIIAILSVLGFGGWNSFR